MNVTFRVSGKAELATITEKLRQIPNVIDIKRV